jgi:hypothetical protein
MHHFGVPKLRKRFRNISIHSTPMDPNALFRGIEVVMHPFYSIRPKMMGNISGGNQPLCANYGNFNRSYTMLIQGKTYRKWEGWCAKVTRGGRDDLQKHLCKSPLPPPMSPPLDQHRVAPIDVSIVCTEGLVSTSYIPKMMFGCVLDHFANLRT